MSSASPPVEPSPSVALEDSFLFVDVDMMRFEKPALGSDLIAALENIMVEMVDGFDLDLFGKNCWL